ncbi:hypothetical protein ZYGR_0I01080 [Zygosaccharomyces rouxii]|uniref:ZYRO0C02618p n=2 Tax=Zygosaccharomyces rouxii TaxID=4956 RepID=C5DSS5_ZYGRC|nr:uncharacterized protein ZYRO0C02618g [Zygosaccharomyces rouxii]KAH9201974.1 P-loop containing nucleoside triphosphate hydrolase protein [Zygosaccharomyces rouxii]GAV47812.1 hypothetical protein ZYGR_0I01080 [Zygosaccharomyces rouxii]CAR26836.1 ZYRO0C02618p [Zygosaccharomyces rouxii]
MVKGAMSRKRLSVSIHNSPLSPVIPICPPSSNPASPQVGDEGLTFTRQPRETSNVKLLLVGDAGVGKTAMILGFCNELPTKSQLHIMNLTKDSSNDQDKSGIRPRNVTKKRYSLNDYEELFHGADDLDEYVLDTRTTIGVDIKTSLLNIDSRLFKCIMWDTAGQERYRNAMIPVLYRDAHAIVLTYDLCDVTTLNSICDHWLKEALDNYGSKDLTKVRFYLIGNKRDLTGERTVTQEQVSQSVATLESKFQISIAGTFEVTCKWPNIVDRTFNQLVRDLVANGCYDSKPNEVPSRSKNQFDNNNSDDPDELGEEDSDQKGLGVPHQESPQEEVRMPGGIDLTRPYSVGNNSSTCCV